MFHYRLSSERMYRVFRYACQNEFMRTGSLIKPLHPLSTTAQHFDNMNRDDSFARGIFSGKVKTKRFHPYLDTLNDEARETLRIMLNNFEKYFAEVHDAKQNDTDETTLEKPFAMFKEIGGLGLKAPEKYGGLEFNYAQFSRVVEVFGKYDLSFTITAGVHQSIGYQGLVLFGTEEQKQKYLPDLAAGKKIAAFALTEPTAGSDAAALRTKAVLDNDGKHYILNGNKLWTTNGGIAGIITVFARVERRKEDPEDTAEGITAFIIEKDFPGVSNGPPEKKMGLRSCNTAALYFDNVKVPVENVIGKVGEGFKIALSIVNTGRFGINASLVGTTRELVRRASDHVNTRVQFNQKLIEFQAIQEKLAKMAMFHYAIESITLFLCNNMDGGITDIQLETAMSKIFTTEAAWYCIDECIQVLGGNGYMRDNDIERHLRDARVFRIFEGANDTLRLFVASTGIQAAAKRMRESQKSMKDCGSQESDKEQGNSDLVEAVATPLRDSALKVTQRVEEFSSAVKLLLHKHGKDIGNQQFLLTRLANSAVDLFAMTAVLTRATGAINKGLASSNHEQLLAKTFVVEGCTRVKRDLQAIKDPENLTTFAAFSQIASEISQNDAIVATRPLGF